MIPNASQIASIALLLWHPYRAQTTAIYGSGQWRLTIATDQFTQRTTCVLKADDSEHISVVVQSTSLAFQFNRRLNTSDAWYRVDSGPAHSTRNDVATLRNSGVFANADSLFNPSDGVILIPINNIINARQIQIQSTRHARPTAFNLGLLWPLFDYANTLDCGLGISNQTMNFSPETKIR